MKTKHATPHVARKQRLLNKMNIETLNAQNKLASWARLVRFHTVLPTALIPIIAYVTVRPLTIQDTGILLVLTGLVHMFVCASNDYIDLKDDLFADDKQHRPLVSGKISKFEALVGLFVILALILVAASHQSSLVVVVVLLALTVSYLYNRDSGNKWYADLWYVLSILTAALLGVVLAGGYTKYTAFLMLALTIHAFFQVQEGHMKDLNEDEHNVIQRLGLDVTDGSSVNYPYGFKGGVEAIKTAELLLIIAVIDLTLVLSLSRASFLLFTTFFLLGILGYYYSLANWLVTKFDRQKVIKYITLHELSSITLILLAVITHGSLTIMLFLVVTPIWLVVVNYFIHDDLIAPDI